MTIEEGLQHIPTDQALIIWQAIAAIFHLLFKGRMKNAFVQVSFDSSSEKLFCTIMANNMRLRKSFGISVPPATSMQMKKKEDLITIYCKSVIDPRPISVILFASARSSRAALFQMPTCCYQAYEVLKDLILKSFRYDFKDQDGLEADQRLLMPDCGSFDGASLFRPSMACEAIR